MAFEFTDEQRAIFEYNNGRSAVRADPLEIRRRMLFTLPNVTQLIREHQIGEQQLSVKERQIYRLAVERIIAHAMKGGWASANELTKAVDEDPKFVQSILTALMNGGVIECNAEGLYHTVGDGGSTYFAGAEEQAKMTGEEASVIRFGKKAEETLCNGFREVFDMKIDEAGEGPTDAMVWAVFRHYQDWMEKKSGSQQKKPTS